MSDAVNLKSLYDKALKEAIKANDAKNKIVINKLRNEMIIYLLVNLLF